MKKILFFCLLSVAAIAQQPISVQMAESLIHTHPDSITVKPGKPAGWDYEQGLYLKALESRLNRILSILSVSNHANISFCGMSTIILLW